MLATKTSGRAIEISSSSWSSSRPAWPTNGMPCRSSFAPGASPTNKRSAFALPEPNTTVVRVDASWGQRVQTDACCQTDLSASRRSAAPDIAITLSAGPAGSLFDPARCATILGDPAGISMRELDRNSPPEVPVCAVIGAGCLGTAMAAGLAAGRARGPLRRGEAIPADAEVVLLSVPDGQIAA